MMASGKSKDGAMAETYDICSIFLVSQDLESSQSWVPALLHRVYFVSSLATCYLLKLEAECNSLKQNTVTYLGLG